MAAKERHYTDHNQPWAHSIVHDHIIIWKNGVPDFNEIINYYDGNIPEFKKYKGVEFMTHIVKQNSLEDNRFKSISEFKFCMRCGGEVEFEFHDKIYNMTHSNNRNIRISEAFRQETEKICKDSDELLEYVIDGVRLRDIITEVDITDRTI